MLPEFEMVLPQTLDEALKTMAARQVVPIAGGTNVVVDLRSGRHTPKAIINIHNLKELSGIKVEEGWVKVGGGTLIREMERSSIIAEHGLCLQQSARLFANPLIRNRATVGGNLADASPAADTATPLLALGASLLLVSASGTRLVPLEEFFLHVRKTVLKSDELIGEVRWQIPTTKSANAFYKLGLRKADAISVVSAAVMVESDGERIACARIALGSVAPTPLRVKKAEEILKGQKPSPELFLNAASLAEQAVSPISDVRASADYRREMSGVLVARLLRQTCADIWK